MLKLRWKMMTADGFTCGRRNELFAYQANRRGEDYYSMRDGAPRCSYCGSISEEKFFEYVDQGATVEPTDKNYKAYVSGEGIAFTKFYFQHLSESGMHKFVEYMNAGKFKLAYPGRFYRAPFFVMYQGSAPLQG